MVGLVNHGWLCLTMLDDVSSMTWNNGYSWLEIIRHGWLSLFILRNGHLHQRPDRFMTLQIKTRHIQTQISCSSSDGKDRHRLQTQEFIKFSIPTDRSEAHRERIHLITQHSIHLRYPLFMCNIARCTSTEDTTYSKDRIRLCKFNSKPRTYTNFLFVFGWRWSSHATGTRVSQVFYPSRLLWGAEGEHKLDNSTLNTLEISSFHVQVRKMCEHRGYADNRVALSKTQNALMRAGRLSLS